MMSYARIGLWCEPPDLLAEGLIKRPYMIRVRLGQGAEVPNIPISVRLQFPDAQLRGL